MVHLFADFIRENASPDGRDQNNNNNNTNDSQVAQRLGYDRAVQLHLSSADAPFKAVGTTTRPTDRNDNKTDRY